MGKVDPKLEEMADVFHMPKKARMKYITLPARLPGVAKLLNRKSEAAAAGAEAAGEKTAAGAEAAGGKTAAGAEAAGEKTAAGAEAAGGKTAGGKKHTGGSHR